MIEHPQFFRRAACADSSLRGEIGHTNALWQPGIERDEIHWRLDPRSPGGLILLCSSSHV